MGYRRHARVAVNRAGYNTGAGCEAGSEAQAQATSPEQTSGQGDSMSITSETQIAVSYLAAILTVILLATGCGDWHYTEYAAVIFGVWAVYNHLN